MVELHIDDKCSRGIEMVELREEILL